MEPTTTTAPARPVTTLLDLANEANALLNTLLLNGGELTVEVQAQLDAYTGGRDTKLDRARMFCVAAKAQADMLKDEERRLADRRHALEAAVVHVRDRMTVLLIENEKLEGTAKLKTGTASYWLAPTESIVGPDEPQAWPPEFQEVAIHVDKASAKAALKAGTFPTGLFPDVRLVVEYGARWR